MSAKEKKPADDLHRYGLWSKWWVKNGVFHTHSGTLLTWQKHVALTQVINLRYIALGPLCLVQLVTAGGVINLPFVRPKDRPLLMLAWENCNCCEPKPQK